ncbi:hypothetical protein [Phycicoccus avicenniae]|uniref:hypothetical protein n=1 Tax=Phycicoccus avicenniae TaxID=2828860 RepID=UPI003D2DCB9A
MVTMADKVKFVDVVDADGEVMPGFEHPVPEHWVGSDLLPAGAKKKGRSSSGSSSKQEPPAGGGVPAVSSTRPELEAYATGTAGFTEDEAKAFATKEELHAELVKRASSSS